jgi:cell division protein FtsQ
MSPTVTDSRTGTAGSSALRVEPELRRQLEHRRSLRRRLVGGAVAGVVLVVVAVLVWLLVASPVLAAKHVTVVGQRELTAEQVADAAAVPLGVPLIRQDLDAIAQRATTLPQVAAASVERHWPSTVTVTVTERRPLLAILQPTGYALVDAQGVAFETRPRVPAGVLKTDADPGNAPLLADLGVVAAALPDGLRLKIDRLKATAGGDVTLVLASGTTVHWGDAAESPLKAQVVAALLRKKPRSIDVSAPHNPAVR